MAKAKIVEVDETEKTVTCPRCGVTIIDEDGFGDEPPCQHVRFVYGGEQFGFGYIAHDIERELDEAQQGADNGGTAVDVQNFLQENISDDGVIIQRTEHGRTCGPVSLTMWIGIR